MARINNPVRSPAQRTHEGAIASRISPKKQLERTIMACLLWEDGFYEDGATVADRIIDLAKKVPINDAVEIMKKASKEYKLRHAPLLLAISLLNHGVDAKDIASVITRADSLTEILAMYWKNGKIPLSHKLKKALDIAFRKFDEYNLAKYDRDGAVKLRDVLRIVRPKPESKEQGELWGKVIERSLKIPDTWEVALSAGKGKKETFERLLMEGGLGDLAFLRNLRNMIQADVRRELITESFENREWKWILPYQFIAAAKYAPTYERYLDNAMKKALENLEKLRGRTAILIDVSGSMDAQISGKSELTRWDAAVALAMLLEGVCDNLRIFPFNEGVKEVPVRSGFGLRDVIPPPAGGTDIGHAVGAVGASFNRIIIITDEQSNSHVNFIPGVQYYVLNVATNQNGIGYGKNVVHIDGFSEASVRYITEYEKGEVNG